MSARAGFALSLLAACGIHAVLLLVPRGAIVDAAPVPAVVLELTEVGPPPQQPAAVPPVTRAVAPRAPVREKGPQESPPPPPVPEAAPGNIETSVPSPAQDEGTAVVEHPAAATGRMDAAGVPFADAANSGGGSSRTVAASAPEFTAPQPMSEILPKYPLVARRSGFEGVVKVSVQVNAAGEVTSVEIVVSSGHASLDRAVIDAYRQARFAPALEHGSLVPYRFEKSYRFQLTAASTPN